MACGDFVIVALPPSGTKVIHHGEPVEECWATEVQSSAELLQQNVLSLLPSSKHTHKKKYK